jgi:hypothetical protein
MKERKARTSEWGDAVVVVVVAVEAAGVVAGLGVVSVGSDVDETSLVSPEVLVLVLVLVLPLVWLLLL